MEKTQIKKIIILILALMNVFLLFIVGANTIDRVRTRNARNQSLFEVLESRSIDISGDVKLIDSAPIEITLARNLKNEQKMLTSLIGNTTATDKGGNIYYYSGISGSASFRGTGDFQLAFDSNNLSAGSDPVRNSISVLRKMGIDSTEDGAVVTGDASNTLVTLNCVYKGKAVFNIFVNCYYTNDALRVIEGRRPLDDVESTYTPDEHPDIATIIMNFLNYLDEKGEVCSQITAIDQGYFAKSRDLSSYALFSVWRISTDVGTYYFDALTGAAVNTEG